MASPALGNVYRTLTLIGTTSVPELGHRSAEAEDASPVHLKMRCSGAKAWAVGPSPTKEGSRTYAAGSYVFVAANIEHTMGADVNTIIMPQRGSLENSRHRRTRSPLIPVEQVGLKNGSAVSPRGCRAINKNRRAKQNSSGARRRGAHP